MVRNRRVSFLPPVWRNECDAGAGQQANRDDTASKGGHTSYALRCDRSSGGRGAAIIFQFHNSQSIGYAEGRGSGRLIEAPDDVDHSLACYDHIRAAALPRSATLEFLKARVNGE